MQYKAISTNLIEKTIKRTVVDENSIDVNSLVFEFGLNIPFDIFILQGTTWVLFKQVSATQSNKIFLDRTTSNLFTKNYSHFYE